MNLSGATVETLTALLPELDELEMLRLRLFGVAVPDPGKKWDSSSDFSTIDKRIVTPEAAERALDEAAESLRQHATLLHDGLKPVLRAYYEGRSDDCARALVALGEQLEGGGRVQAAGRCYQAALDVAGPLQDKGPQILALRRIGRAALTVGEFAEAALKYERSADLAHDAGDVPGEVIACTGLGNVRMWQGRWGEAEQCYHQALELADTASPPLTVERGQIYNNLANLTTRQKRLDQSEVWFESAFRLWESVSSPIDLAICHFNHALLREAQDRWAEARHDYEAALALPVPPSFRSALASDFAEWWLHEEHLSQAEEWGREAEAQAIASRSPYALGYMYRGRGNIAHARGDADGFTFFEKALEIAREKGYANLEAETLLDYAELRSDNGGAEEAVAYLERARDIFRDLGAVGALERAERALAARAARAGDDEDGGFGLSDPPLDTDPLPPLAAAD